MRLLSDSLFKELKKGSLHAILEFIKNDDSLDFQIRENYVNVYYKGGNILKIRPRSFDFDKMYFHSAKDQTSSDVKSDKTKLSEFVKKRELLLSHLQENPQEYFRKAKAVMDEWDEALSDRVQHNEKKEQQQIALANQRNTDYVVLDLEYAVSSTSPFKYDGKEDKHVPRFDLIAIHNGRLVVIELKKGLGAVPGTSGIKPHMDCFEYTIGRDINGLFIREMRTLLAQKKALGLLDDTLEIKDEKPMFMFAFADEKGKDEFAGFVNKCREKRYEGEFIYLGNEHKLRRREL